MPILENKIQDQSGLLTISQGMLEKSFPKGFALPVANKKGNSFFILAQALNNNKRKNALYFRFKFQNARC